MKNNKRLSKTVNIVTAILDIIVEIVLLPIHVIKTILDIATELFD